ncbi:MAG: hypothetical protein WCR72_10875 [Bacteroidota bacterium]
MKNNALLLVFYLCFSNFCISQNNYTIASGESPVHKKTDKAKALNEAILDAQANAVIAYGGNVNVLNVSKKENVTNSQKSGKDKQYKTSGSFAENDKFLLQNSISAMVKNIDLESDTLWLNSNKFKVRVKGKFEVNLKDLGNYVSDYLSNSEQKIKIEIVENDCFGQIYKPMSEYINRKKNNFIFSNQPWLLGESDYKIEINTDRAILYDKRLSPNVVIRVYPYENCQSIIDQKNDNNKLLDEIINDIYAVYFYKSVK